MHLHLDAHLFHREAHRGADVLQRVDRRHREVAALHRRTMAHVAALELLARRPRGLLREHLAVAARHVDVPLDGVEDEELGLGAEVARVAEAGRLEVRLGALGERARIALVALAVRRLDHVARDEQRRLVHERIDVGGARIRHQQHVGRLDALPAGDRRAVERMAAVELVLRELPGRHGDVLLLAARVREAKVDELDLLVLIILRTSAGVAMQISPELASWKNAGSGTATDTATPLAG